MEDLSIRESISPSWICQRTVQLDLDICLASSLVRLSEVMPVKAEVLQIEVRDHKSEFLHLVSVIGVTPSASPSSIKSHSCPQNNTIDH